MSISSIIFCLPTYFSPTDKRSTGGTISNFLLINELSRQYHIDVISPIISRELLLHKTSNIDIITKVGLEKDFFLQKIAKKIWLNYIIKKKYINSNVDLIVGTNGTINFMHNFASKKIVVLTRAFEDFLELKILGENKRERIRKNILKKIINNNIINVYQNASIIITNSNFMKNKISNYFSILPDKIKILYPPINVNNNYYRSLPTNKKITIGIINPKKIKGEDIFIGLARSLPNIDFVYFSKSCRKYRQNNIKYLGWGTSVQVIFNSFDFLIVPSIWDEPFGRVAVEAIRSGIPALVSNRGGIPETVDDEFIVKENTISCWKTKIENLIANPVLIKNAWKRSFKLSNNFSITSYNKQIKSIFSSIQ